MTNLLRHSLIPTHLAIIRLDSEPPIPNPRTLPSFIFSSTYDSLNLLVLYLAIPTILFNFFLILLRSSVRLTVLSIVNTNLND